MNTTLGLGKKSFLVMSIAAACSISAYADDKQTIEIEEILVQGQTTYASSLVTESMLNQQSSFTSINSVIDNLPGVTVNEGDIYGFDDWSTSITIRGYSTDLSDQQVGTTLDGMPNGGSNYGGGAKANRYIDPANVGGVEVSQGTADIASRSHEALGGTINFKTDDPTDERRIRVETSLGEQDAHRYYLRYDTGLVLSNTRAWVSYSSQDATDWDTGTAENEREHFAAKLISSFDMMDVTAYLSYDDIQEDNYQRVYSEAQYDAIPNADGLTGTWTGVPVEDQLYRRGWSTLRENLFGYVKFDIDVNEDLNIESSVYFHQNEGRGDWLPPYLVDVSLDSAGHSEFLGGTTHNGTPAGTEGRVYFVDAAGNSLTPNANCTPSYTIQNWYGVPQYTAGAVEDPSCYGANAIAVQSFRNTHYEKDRLGFNFDATYQLQIGGTDNEIRSGLWVEQQTRDEYRDWHSVDTRSGFNYSQTPYWVQYDRSYPQDTVKWYLQDNISVGDVIISVGFKQFLVDLEREDQFDRSVNASIDSDSDVLFSGGVVWTTPVEALEAFFGYSENFKALSDEILERPAADFSQIEPETSENIELGVRYNDENVSASAVYFMSDFENRLLFLDNSAAGVGPNFLIGTNGSYFNSGGIESEGLELSGEYFINSAYKVYAAYTYTDSVYLGSGDPAVDAIIGLVPGNKVAGIPENQFVVSFDWSTDVAYAGVSAKLTGDRQVNAANTWTAESYTITDVYAGYDFDKLGYGISNLRVSLVVNNLFDEEYLGTIAQNAAWIGGPRTYGVSAVFDF